jgi:mono/diheme cytochrome c family protein
MALSAAVVLLSLEGREQMNHYKLRYVFLCVMMSVGPVQHANAGEAEATATPFDLSDQARIDAGKKRFGANCAAYCHGSEGEGGKTPRFKGNKDFSPTAALKTITEGRKGADVMPPWGNAFTPEQIWELIAYLNFLSKQPAPQ